MPAPPHLGVDFGTSHTVAVLRRSDGRVDALMFGGTALLPSGVAAGPDGALTVGATAAHAARNDPASFEPHPKRRIDDGTVLLGERDVDVEEMFAAVLGEVRARCLEVARSVPEAVTLTHPAAWGPRRRRILRSAAVKAGFPAARLVPEPVAAAAYYARELGHEVPVGAAVVVHDFGGGTFDASVVRRTADGFEVLAVDGLDDLGGVDIDEAMVQYLRSQYPDDGWGRLLNPATSTDRRNARLLREDVRSAKELLSGRTTADLHIPLLERDVHVTREELERITAPLLARAVEVTSAVIEESGVPAERIAGVFLVGGGSRMPLVATLLHREFGRAPVLADHIELVVAHGAILEGRRAAWTSPPQPPPPPPVYAPAPAPGPPVYAPMPRPPVLPPVLPLRAAPAAPAPRAARMSATVWLFGALLGLELIAVFVPKSTGLLNSARDTAPFHGIVFILLLGLQIALWLRTPTARRILIAGQLVYAATQVGIALVSPSEEIASRLPLIAAGVVGAELVAARVSATWYRVTIGPSWRVIAATRQVLTALALLVVLLSALVADPPWSGFAGDSPDLRRIAAFQTERAYTDIAVGETIAVGGRADGRIDVFSAVTGEVSGTFDVTSEAITDVALSYVDGHDAAVVGVPGSAHVLAADTGAELCKVDARGFFGELATMIVDGLPLMASGDGDELGVWSLGDCDSRDRFDTPQEVSGEVGILSRDGTPVAIFADDAGVMPGVDLRSGTPATPRFSLPGRPNLAVTADGDLVTAIGTRLSAWDIATGAEKTRVDLDAAITDGSLAVLRDGTRLITATVDDGGTLRVFDLETDREIGRYQLGVGATPPRLGFSTDGSRHLVVGFGDQNLIFAL